MTVHLPSGCSNLSWFVPPLLTKPFCSKNRTTSLRLTILSPILYTVNTIYNFVPRVESDGLRRFCRRRAEPSEPFFVRRLASASCASPSHGRSLFADGGIAFLPYLYDNQLVLRADGVRPACIFPVLARFRRASNVILTRRACVSSAVSMRRTHRSLADPARALRYRDRSGKEGMRFLSCTWEMAARCPASG